MLRKLLMMIVGLGTVSGAALAATLNVGPGMTYTTIQSAINAANNGDTVLVAPGTYYENIDFKGKAITVTSVAGAATTVIDGGGNGAAVTFKTGEPRSAILSGFTIQHGGSYAGPQAFSYIGAVYFSGSSATLLNNNITQSYCWGVEAYRSAPLVQGNDISVTQDHGNCSFGGGAAIYIGGNLNGASPTQTNNVIPLVLGNTVENNVDSGTEDAGGNGGAGVAVWGGSPLIENNIFRNNASPGGSGGAINIVDGIDIVILQNLIYNNSAGCGGGAIATQGNGIGGSFAVIVANNTIINNTGTATAGYSECVNVSQIYPSPDAYGDAGPTQVFVNNIISGSSSSPAVVCDELGAASEAKQPIFDHNVLYNSGGPFFDKTCVDVSAKYGNVVADPQFVGAAANNYQLQAGSPAIDAGNNSILQSILALDGATLPKDFAGNARLQDATGKGYPIIDIGAYEFGGLNDASPTTVALTSSSYYGSANSSYVLTATFSSQAGIPTGTATFYMDGAQLGTSLIGSNGIATLSNFLMTPGVHSLYVTYPGQGSFTPATSVIIIVNISKYTTVLSLSSSANPSLIGQAVTFTVQASSADSSYTPSPITLTDGSTNTTLATLTPDATGKATYTTSTLALGYHNITASYAGDASHTGSSAYVYQNVENGYATNTAVSAAPNPSSVGQSVSFAARVSSSVSGAGTPTGSVVFSYGSTTLGTVVLDANGNASVSTSALPQGSDTVTATYQPSGAFTASSATVVEQVNGLAQTVTLAQPASPAYVATSIALSATASSGQPVTYKVVSGPANVSGSTLTYTGAGTVVIEADQAGGNGYQAASAQATVTATLLNEPVGTASGAVVTLVTMANAGTLGSIQVVTQGAAAGSSVGSDFTLMPGGTCAIGVTYAAGQTCTVMFGFDPTRPGQRYGGLLFSDGSGNAMANRPVYGIGVGPQVGFLPGIQGLLGSGLNQPSGVAVDGNGNVFVSQLGAGLTEISATGAQTTVGSFSDTTDVAVDGSGDVIVTDESRVYEVLAVNGSVPASPTVLTLGSVPLRINGVAVDATGNIFLATGSTAGQGVLSEFQAVNGAIPQPSTPISLGSGFGILTGVAVDASNNVYVSVSDQQNDAVEELMAVNGVIPASPVIRSLGSGFNEPSNVRLDAANDVYVTDAGASAVYEVLAVNGSVPSTNAMVRTLGKGFSAPQGMVIDARGNVFFADEGQADVVTLNYSGVPTLSFATTPVGSTSSDSPQTATLFNNGNAPLVFTVPASGSNASISPGFTIGSGSTCPQVTSTTNPAPTLAAGGYCTEVISFTPVVAGVDNGKLIASDNALNATNAMQTVLLNGTGLAATSTTIASSLNPAGVGVSVTFTATVSSNSGMPTGTVVFSDGTTQIGTGTLTNGVATFSTSALTLGTHTITATYAATAAFGGSSASLTQVVGYQSVTTTAVSPEPSTYGQPVTFTVHVVGAAGSTGVPSGTVMLTFCHGAQISITLDANGNGSVVQPYPGSSELSEPVGSCPYTANYAGDAYFYPSASTSTTYIVNPSPSTTTVSGAPNPGFVGQPVTLTATVAGSPSPTLGPGGVVLPPGATVATGTVQFFDGAVSLGTASLSGAPGGAQTASLTTSTLAVGAHSITAVYSGDANLNGSTSSVFVETIEVVPTATTLSATPNPGEQNHVVTLAVSVAALLGTAAPNGPVAIYDGTVLLKTVTPPPSGGLVSSLSFPVVGLAPGTHTLQAFFTSIHGFLPSQSNVVSLVILPQDFTLTANPPTMTVQTEHHGTMMLQLASLGGFRANIALSCNGPVPKWVTCYLPGPVALAADATVPVSFTIDTDAVQFFKSENAPPMMRGRGLVVLAGLAPLALLGFARRRRGLLQVSVVCALSLAALGMTACSGYYPAHTEPGTYTVTVTATGTADGATAPTTHTLDVTLVVTP